MDNLALQALVGELSSMILGSRCVQVAQVRPRTVMLELSGAASGYLVFDMMDPPACFFTKKIWSFENPSPFVGLMRKWLAGAELRGATKSLDERILYLEFSSPTHRESDETLTLVSELMPRWGNLYLLDSQCGVLGSMLMPRAERRKLEVGATYAPPGKHGECSLEQFVSQTGSTPNLSGDSEKLTKQIRGLGPAFAREVLHRSRQSGRTPHEVLTQLLLQIMSGKTQPRIYRSAGGPSESFISPVELQSLANQPVVICHSTNQALEAVFEKRTETLLGEEKRKRVRKSIQSTLKRFRYIEEKITEEARGFLQEIELQRIADLILAQLDHLHPQGGKVELLDVFEPHRPKRTVVLDPRLNLVANAQRFYEKAKRARRGIEKIQARQKSICRVIATLESSLKQLSLAPSLVEIEEISRVLQRTGMNGGEITVVRQPRPKMKTPSPSSAGGRKKKRCRVFKSANDTEILVGRNSKENDRVTTQYAQPEDYWFHVADYAGAHVVLRNPTRGNLEETNAFLQAAQLAAYFSQARNAPKVLVHWTQKKFVKKPKRAKPGLVTLSKFQSITVEPKLPTSSDSSESSK